MFVSWIKTGFGHGGRFCNGCSRCSGGSILNWFMQSPDFFFLFCCFCVVLTRCFSFLFGFPGFLFFLSPLRTKQKYQVSCTTRHVCTSFCVHALWVFILSDILHSDADEIRRHCAMVVVGWEAEATHILFIFFFLPCFLLPRLSFRTSLSLSHLW